MSTPVKTPQTPNTAAAHAASIGQPGGPSAPQVDAQVIAGREEGARLAQMAAGRAVGLPQSTLDAKRTELKGKGLSDKEIDGFLRGMAAGFAQGGEVGVPLPSGRAFGSGGAQDAGLLLGGEPSGRAAASTATAGGAGAAGGVGAPGGAGTTAGPTAAGTAGTANAAGTAAGLADAGTQAMGGLLQGSGAAALAAAGLDPEAFGRLVLQLIAHARGGQNGPAEVGAFLQTIKDPELRELLTKLVSTAMSEGTGDAETIAQAKAGLAATGAGDAGADYRTALDAAATAWAAYTASSAKKRGGDDDGQTAQLGNAALARLAEAQALARAQGIDGAQFAQAFAARATRADPDDAAGRADAGASAAAQRLVAYIRSHPQVDDLSQAADPAATRASRRRNDRDVGSTQAGASSASVTGARAAQNAAEAQAQSGAGSSAAPRPAINWIQAASAATGGKDPFDDFEGA